MAVVDAVSFLVAAGFVAWIPLSEERPVREPQHWWAEMTGGLRHLVHERLLGHTLVAFGQMLLVFGFSEAAIFAILDAFDKRATFAGVLVGLALLAGSLAVIAATYSLVVMLAAVVALGYSLPVLLIAFTTLMQRRTPQALMGRISAAVEVVMGLSRRPCPSRSGRYS